MYNFHVCSFKQNLFVIGGNYKYETFLNTCLKYEVKHNKWSSIGNMNERKDDLACTVFDGKIVVSGGWNSRSDLKSVEAYDHHDDKWIFLPDMHFERYEHSAVSMGNKMFIIGGFVQGNSCEVYDKISQKFSCITSPEVDMLYVRNVVNQPYCVGNKIVLITGWYENTVHFSVYDVDESSWSTQVKHLL